MAIDRKPAPGRYLLIESMLRHGFCRFAGTIVKVSGTRVYYRDMHMAELYEVPVEEIPLERYPVRYTSSIAAVCDTLEEVNLLKAYDDAARREVNAVFRKNQEGWGSLFTKEEPATEPTKRVVRKGKGGA